MYLVNAEQMRGIDNHAIKEIGIPGQILMENAGRQVYNIISSIYFNNPSDSNNKINICVLSGTGNNGGDGLVIARHLFNNSCKVNIVIVGSPAQMQNDTLVNYKILKKSKANIIIVKKISETKKIVKYIKDSNFIIDALLGTGLARNVEGLFAKIIELANNSSKKIISVDIPSGINADTGKVLGTAVRAFHTVTMCLPKRGLFLFPGKEYAGKISVVDISIPYSSINKKINTNLLLWEGAKKFLPSRPQQAHKGNFGKIFILSGSRDYIGAPVLTSQSALIAGSGLVYVGIPKNLYPILAKKFLEQIPVVLPETENGTISLNALEIINKKIKSLKIDCLVIGPGLGINKETGELVKALLSIVKIPIILDADGINSLNGDTSFFKRKNADIVLTPHTGEFSRLTNKEINLIEENRIEAVENFISKYGSVLVLKGMHSLIGYKKEIYMNLTGNSGMATAGSGDVLTGMIASFIGQKRDIFNAAKLAVFLHGRAGDIAVKKKNEMSILASDILNNIPHAINELMKYNKSPYNSTYSLGDIVSVPSFFLV